MAKSGLPKKYAKLGFKKGWKAFKKAKSSATSKVKKATKRVVAKATTKRRKAPIMAKRKTVRRRRKVSFLSGRVGSALLNGGIVGSGVLAGTVLVNKVPLVSTRPNWEKALYQSALGIIGLTMLKSPIAKKFSSGIVASSAMTLITPMLPDAFSLSGRNLSAQEIEEIKSLGIPSELANSYSMGIPASLGVPAQLGNAYSRGSRKSSRY